MKSNLGLKVNGVHLIFVNDINLVVDDIKAIESKSDVVFTSQ